MARDVPSPQPIIVPQHLVEMTDHAAGRSIGEGLLEDALWQGVVLTRKPGPRQEQALCVENPLTGKADLGQGIAGAGRGIEQFHDALYADSSVRNDQVAHREEYAQAGRVDHCEGVLPVLNQLGLVGPGEWIYLKRYT